MKQNMAVQKEQMKDINIDELEDLKDDMDDMQWQQKEIDEAMNRNYACDIDEAELDDELRDYDDEIFKETLQ